MSDLSVSARDNKSLEDLKQEQEQKLRDLRAGYQRQKADETESGEAAVNHIRRSTEERVDQTRAESERKLKNESDSIGKTYADLKRRSNQQSENANERVHEIEEQSSENIAAAHKNETTQIKQTQKKLSEFMESQNELRHQAAEGTNQAIEKNQKKGAEKIADGRERAQHELTKIEKESKQNLERTKAHDEAFYEQTRSRDEERFERIKSSDDKKVEREQHEKGVLLSDLAHKYQEESQNERRLGEGQLHSVRKEEQDKFDQIRSHGTRVSENTQAAYSGEVKRIQREGQEAVRNEQEKYDDLKKTQQVAHEQKIKQFDGDLSFEEAAQQKERIARMKISGQTFDRQMNNQRNEFQKRYDASDKANSDSLTTQKEAYLAALFKQKQKFDKTYDGNNDRQSDPFYSLKTFNPSLHEKSGSYVLYAKVAPYEKDNVQIFVKDDRITISAKRKYEDSFANKDGDRTTTNSYQTFRQEFKLDSPVDAKFAIHKVDDDGTITVIAPKRGTGGLMPTGEMS